MAQVKIVGKKTLANTTQPMGNMNVLEAAKWRLKRIMQTHDNFVVSFSGGKDSLALLHLTRIVKEELGDKTPVNVVFRDEELIPDHIVDFVDYYRCLPWVNMTWFTVPLKSQKYILGKTFDYIQWDPNRENYVREKPSWSISDDSKIYDQYNMDARVAAEYKGKVCIMTGIRCSESIIRLKAVLNVINEAYVCASSAKGVRIGRPIYDWEENDVFKFFYDEGIPYAEIYDRQSAQNQALRVSTPLHAESAKSLDKWRTLDAEFYDRVLKVFPEMGVQDKYGKQFDKFSNEQEDPKDWIDLRFWIANKFEGDQLKHAMARYRECVSYQKNPKIAPKYSFEYCLKLFKGGVVKRAFLPDVKGKK